MSDFRLDRLEERLGLLLDRHAGGADLSALAEQYRADPVGFARDVLHADPWSKQVAILEAVRDAPRTVVRGCNAAGKDHAAACAALWWYATRPGATVLLTGPTLRQVAEILFGTELRRLFDGSDLPGERFTTALRGPGGALVLGFTSGESSRLTGYHSPGGVLAILTEGQGVEPFAYEAMLANTTGAGDRLLVVGNPLVPHGPFFEACRSADWRRTRISAFDHPNLTGERTIPGGVTPEWVELVRREYGAASGVYRARVLGEFPDEATDGLVRRSWLEAAAARWAEQEAA
ncbi:MAG TPA: hypothetical protein VF142_06835 [Longimicrobium sp.]